MNVWKRWRLFPSPCKDFYWQILLRLTWLGPACRVYVNESVAWHGFKGMTVRVGSEGACLVSIFMLQVALEVDIDNCIYLQWVNCALLLCIQLPERPQKGTINLKPCIICKVIQWTSTLSNIYLIQYPHWLPLEQTDNQPTCFHSTFIAQVQIQANSKNWKLKSASQNRASYFHYLQNRHIKMYSYWQQVKMTLYK